MPIDLSGVDLRLPITCATIMLAGAGRDRLTMQALRSYTTHTDGLYNRLFVVVEDDKQKELIRRLCMAVMPGHMFCSTEIVYAPSAKGNLGELRNWGAIMALRSAHPSYLHFVDNDVCFLPDYQTVLMEALGTVDIVGGCRHPYHVGRLIRFFSVTVGTMSGTLVSPDEVLVWKYALTAADAVAGYSMFMRASTFTQLGGFVTTGKGIAASEDWEYCQRAKVRGKRVAYVEPAVLLHCGLTNSNGDRCTGADEIEKQLDKFSKEHPEVGLLYE